MQGENLQFTRRLDSERVTSGSLVLEVQQSVMRLEVLFLQGAVTKTGYTAHVLEVLEKPRTIYVDKVAKRLGGLPRPQLAVIACNCFKRCSSWVKLAQEVFAAEFPSFEILQRLSIFHLTPMSERSGHRQSHTAEEKTAAGKIQKFSQVLGLEESPLLSSLLIIIQ